MAMTLRDICTEALEEVGIDPPTLIASGGDLGRQLAALANTTGRDLMTRGYDWQALRTEGTFTTVASETQVANVKTTFPYLKKFLDNTMWNRTTQRRIIGPVTPQSWNRYKADSLSPATELWQLRGNKILFPSVPTAGQSVYFEYVDKRFVQSNDGMTYKEAFTDDSDIPRLDDYLFVLGVRWRFLQKKGMEYGEVFRQYEDYVSAMISSDKPSETVSINPYQRTEGFDTQIPDGNWNI